MARNVQDVALMLSAIAGPDPRSPISIAEPGSLFSSPLDRNFKNVKLAWSSKLGELPVDSRVTQVLADQRHVFDDIDWMRSCYFITVTGLPAISVPCGFTPQGLPVGIQIVGRHNDDLGVLQLAYAFEKETQVWNHRPALVAS